MGKKRIFAIDIARAISIVLVVIGHFEPDGAPDWWLSIHGVLQTFRMPLFMAVSGYTYIYLQREREDKRTSYWGFVWKKFQRLMIPYFFISIFIIAVKLLVGGDSEHPVSLASFYQMFYYPSAAPFLWFVYVLFMVFLIIPFFNTRKELAILFAIALILHFAPIPLPGSCMYLIRFKTMLVFFVLGCLFYEWRNVRTIIMNTNFLVFVTSFVVFYFAAGRCSEITMLEELCFFMASLSGVILIAKIAKSITKKENIQQVFLSVAACSYSIYLFHTTFSGLAKALIVKLPTSILTSINSDLVFIFTALVVTSAGVVGPMILHHIVVRYSWLFSYLIGAKFVGKKE